MLRIFKSNPEKPSRVLVIRLSLAAVLTVLSLGIVVAFIGRAPNRQWNTTRAESVRSFEETEHGIPYSIAIVELDDQGVMWDVRQLEWMLAHLQGVVEAHPDGTIVEIFIHGWKQDAQWRQDGKGRLAQFRNDLESIAARTAAGGDFDSVPGIVGIYIGWRGRSFTIPGLENTTFWNRRVAAHRAASVDLLEILIKVTQLAGSYKDVKMVMMGHSMGGLILEKALTPAIVTSTLSKAASTEAVPIEIDLVVSANPATSALDAHRLIEFFKRNNAQLIMMDENGRIEPARGPLIISLNSEADLVNRISFPLGMWVNGLFLKYRTDTGTTSPSQRTLGIRAAGHEPSLISHTVAIEDGAPVLTTRPGHRDDLPYWIVQIPKEMSGGHSDVSNPLISRFVVDLMERNRVFDPDISLALSTRGELADDQNW